MSGAIVRTLNRAKGGLLHHKRVFLETKAQDTPAKAQPIDKINSANQIVPASRGVIEIYKRIDRQQLLEVVRGNYPNFLKQIDEELEKVDDDELVFIFFEYTDSYELYEWEANTIVKILDERANFIPTLLQPKILRGILSEDESTADAFRKLWNSSETLLQAAISLSDKSPMLVLPLIDWSYMNRLLDLSMENDVRAFCVDFNYYRSTAPQRVEQMTAIMHWIANQDLQDSVLFYGINLRPDGFSANSNLTPAADFAAIWMGIDIIGENHAHPTLSKEVVEAIEEEQEENGTTELDTFDILDIQTISYNPTLIDDITKDWPRTSYIDPVRVENTARSTNGVPTRYEKLLASEQFGLLLEELRSKIDEGDAFSYLRSKEGVTPKVLGAMDKVREGFDEGLQPSLEDFA